MAKKTTCPIGRQEFLEAARPITILINNVPLLAEVKDFNTGSLGWYLNTKTVIEINGQAVPVQINASLIVVGSKDLPREEEPATTSASTSEEQT
jgi:hypothetical protein